MDLRRVTSFLGISVTVMGIGLSGLFQHDSAEAQTNTGTASRGITNVTQAINGDVDAKGRNPVLTVTVQNVSDPKRVKILADANVIASEYRKYPIRFDFYINRNLFASQIRSEALPGPVGVDIGEDVAKPPFNYSVVASIVHPNSQYTTVMEGAAFDTALTARLDCTVTIGTLIDDPDVDGDESSVFVANAVDTNQQSNDQVSATFTGTNETDSEDADFTLSLTVNSSELGSGTASATGTLQVVRDDATQTYQVTGEVEQTTDSLTSISLDSEDATVTLECS